ncbi:DUF1565 domain-containing protein [Candidatus Dojkabacteria bacterium]|jgi:hypothetical protein|nr:DUF1565 domain-containing protein [Candidatus Dojkabacteria bacterium]
MLATQVKTDALTDDLTIVTPLKLGTFLAETTTADLIGYDNATSGLSATTIQDAIDEIDGNLDTQVTSVVYVDGNRSDVYTETGSILKPFLTITDALAVAPAGGIIKVAAMSGGYTEDVTLPDGVSLLGEGDVVTITGDFVTGSAGPINIKNVSFAGTAKTVTINCPASFIDCYSYNRVICNAVVQAYNFHLTPAAGVTALTMNAGGLFQNNLCTIASTGAVPTINGTGG